MDMTNLWPFSAFAATTAAAMLASVFFLSTLLYAAQRDLRTLTIPNGLVLALFLGWSLLAPAAGLAPREMTLSIGAAAMVFFATVAFYAAGWLGGGDSKLMTVAALWLGAGQVVPFVMATMLAGGLIGLAIATARLVPRPLPWTVWIGRQMPGPKADVPYALAIWLGALVIFPRSFWAAAL